MSKREKLRDFLDDLYGRGLLEYGESFSKEEVWNLLGINVPEMGTMQQYSAIQLQELAAIDYVRNALLNEGKYLVGTQTGYRVLLPSENHGQVEAYISSADRKLLRALKLSRNTPKEVCKENCQIEARIAMKRDGIRERIAA